jgi:UDP-glucose 4-epimerase
VKLVTGGAGFIGSHLVDALVARGDDVVVLDNLTTGRAEFLKDAESTKRVKLVKGDCGDAATLRRALKDVDTVYHMAADPDVRAGIKDPWSNFSDGAVLTFRVIDAMRRADVSKFVYASSSTVYGEATVRPTPENYGPLMPASPYGASKLAGEAIVSAFVGTFGFRAWIFRFGNVVGPRLTHGVVFDFAQRLAKDPRRLEILGNGRQNKAYLSATDCVSGILHGEKSKSEPLNILNLASGTTTNVDDIARIVVEAMGLDGVKFSYTGGDRGWKGDIPVMDLDISRMRMLGWRPRHTSEEALRQAAADVASRLGATKARATSTRRKS